MTNEERYFYSGVDAYRLLENEKHNFSEETDEIQLMIIMSQMYFMHFSLTSNYDSLEAAKKIYKEIYDNKEASKKDKFISWSRYVEILVFYEEYDSAIPEVELSVNLAKEYFKPYYLQNEINLEDILSYHSEAIDQLHSIRNLIFVISEKKGNHDWCEDIDKEIHEIFSKVFSFEEIILDSSTEKVNEIFGMDFETIN